MDLSLEWFKANKRKEELEKLALNEQQLMDTLARKKVCQDSFISGFVSTSTANPITNIKLYSRLRLVNNVLTIVLLDGSILTKPNATELDYNNIQNSVTLDEILEVIADPKVLEERKENAIKAKKLENIHKGMKSLSEFKDFEMKDNSIMLKGTNRTLPQLLVEKFLEIIGDYESYYLTNKDIEELLDGDEEYQSLKRFFMWCCLNPRAEVANELYRFLSENSFRITKQGFFVALRNVVTLEGGNELVKFVSNTYNKVKAVWKKSPNHYFVFKSSEDYKLIHENDIYQSKVVTCFNCGGSGEEEFWGDNDDDSYLDSCSYCQGEGQLEEEIQVDHGELIGNLTELYLDLPNRKENRFTDDWTRTFDIRIGQVTSMPKESCNWSTQDCAAAGLHFTADQIHYVGCGDQSVLMLINPMKVVGIGTHKGRCYEYLPIMTVPREEATSILHDLNFDTLELDEDFALRELKDLNNLVKDGFISETKKHQFNLPAMSSLEMSSIILSLNEMKKEINKRVSRIK